MPKKLTKKELEEFRLLLLQKRGIVTGNMDHLEGGMRLAAESDKGAGDSADHGADSAEQDLSLALLESEVDVVQKIDEALERIEEGDFGTCMSCEKAIVKPRLKAIPWTYYCVDCQRQSESF